MKLLVGIPTHKRPELLRDCLESIAAQQGDLPEIELFVADNDPKGRAGVAVVEDLKASYRFPISATTVEVPGISAVRNAILDEARRRNVDFIAMIDDDETASPEWLDQLLRAQESLGCPFTRSRTNFAVKIVFKKETGHRASFRKPLDNKKRAI